MTTPNTNIPTPKPSLYHRYIAWANTWSRSQLIFLIVITAFLCALAIWAANH